MPLDTIAAELKGLAARFSGRAGFKIEWEGEQISFSQKDVFHNGGLIKLPIIIEGFRQFETGKLHPDQPLTIPRGEVTEGSGVLSFMSPKMFLTLKDLLILTAVVSDQTAANYLMTLLGIEEINECIKLLEMEDTVLAARMKEDQTANATTAADIAACLKAVEKGKLLNHSSREHIQKILEGQQGDSYLVPPGRHSVRAAWLRESDRTAAYEAGIYQIGEKTMYAVFIAESMNEEENINFLHKSGSLLFNGLLALNN